MALFIHCGDGEYKVYHILVRIFFFQFHCQFFLIVVVTGLDIYAVKTKTPLGYQRIEQFLQFFQFFHIFCLLKHFSRSALNFMIEELKEPEKYVYVIYFI